MEQGRRHTMEESVCRSETRSCRGFTLIELLVVVAIIAILAAILFPIFVGAKEHARQTKCLNQLMQLGRGIRLYADDWDGRFPTVRVAGGETPAGTYLNWCGSLDTGGETRPEKGQIFPYVRNVAVYLCPSDKGRPAIQNTKFPQPPPLAVWQKNYPLSYSMNIALSWRKIETMERPGDPGSGRNRRLDKILLLIHEDRSTINDGDFNWKSDLDIPDHVHYDGTTVLYCDLHAKWQNKKSLLAARDRHEFDPDYPVP